MSADRYIKRVKRKIKTSQNPLFEKWLKEWKDEAARNGSDMQYCFNKALKSLQKFPIRLYSGQECMILENFGAKLCKKLDEKLEAYKASHPDDLDVHLVNDKEQPLLLAEIANISRKRRSNEGSPIKRKRLIDEGDLGNDKIKNSGYVPTYRSGAYAILVTLYNKSKEGDFKGYLTKAEIEKEAQDLCDSSFKKPTAGSYYTAWSSMGILVKKKLVFKEGKPVRFSLTEEGIQLAMKLKQVGDGSKPENFPSPQKDALRLTPEPISPIKRHEIISKRTPEKDVMCLTPEPVSPIKRHEIISKRTPEKDVMCLTPEPVSPINRIAITRKITPQKDVLRLSPQPISPFKRHEIITKRTPQKDVMSRLTPEPVSPLKRNEITRKRSPQKQIKNALSQETESEPVSEPDETIFMLPGTFEIVLLVDTQERDERFQSAEGMTMRQLKSRKVNFEIRHLKVGDFIWVARDLNTGQELVLPYIIERKRYDDLASSIKDGRFHEQKFRLKQSGIENLIYMVEKYGNENQRLGLPLPTLLQAMANTQVVDGFMVRVTNNHDHSMKYLDCMTTQLNNLFKTKTLMSCKKSNLSPANLSDDLISLMTFNDFNKGSEKNKKPTIRNMLVKQLVQLNGVSLEKAQAIVQLYPTPKALMEGLKRASGEKSIADVTFGGFNRSIGPVTAKHIHMLYTCLDLR